MAFFEKILNSNWSTRLLMSGFFMGASFIILVFFHRIWVWGWVIGVVNLLVPLLFSDKPVFVEHPEEKEPELVNVDKTVKRTELQSFFESLSNRTETGFSMEKVLHLTELILDQPVGGGKMVNYYAKCQGEGYALQIFTNAVDEEHVQIRLSTPQGFASVIEEIG